MRKFKIIISLLSASLILSIGFNYFQMKSYEKATQSFVGTHLTLLGGDLITASNCIENILTGQFDRSFQFGRGSEALVDASNKAYQLSGSSFGGNHYTTWHSVYVSLEQAELIMQTKLSNKGKLDEAEIHQLKSIQKMADIYVDVIKKSDPNTGYIDDLSLHKAEEAAYQFNEALQ